MPVLSPGHIGGSGRTGRTTFVAALVAAVVAAMLTTSAAQAKPAPDAGAGTKASFATGAAAGRQARAERALTRVEKILAGSRAGARRDATLALRDLVLQRGALTGADADRARAILARPSSNKVTCDIVCVHWSTGDVDPTDTTPVNTIPDYIDLVAATVTSVHNTYVGAGYRTPKPDGTDGGDARTDIYIDDIGSQGLYGYCTSDDEPSQGAYDLAAYCVLDNDYSESEFPTNTPSENLQVTAAHEYFHAVQFAYDALEDNWFLEATATWAEDELYDDVDDNVQYLSQSPLTRPRMSMDTFESSTGFHYGVWIFFRYLTERFPTEEGGLPTLVRDMLRRTDGSPGATDEYSLQAVANVLAERGTSLTKVFSEFADANRTPGATYAEGTANRYPTAALWKNVRATGKVLELKLDHLTSATARFTPTAGQKKVKIQVDMANKSRGSSVIVTTYLTSGAATTTLLTLNNEGNGAKSFPFSASTVKFVEVTLVNASGRFDCWQGSENSCQGNSKDNRLVQRVRAIASR